MIHSGSCPWCGEPLPDRIPDRIYCSKRCRQAAWRLRGRVATLREEAEPKRLAYADPPYPGMAARCYGDRPEYRGEVDHVALVSSLQVYDGWALSTSPGALKFVLSLCPGDVHVCPWVKPIGVPRATRGLHTTWEALIVSPARKLRPGLRDWLRATPSRGGCTSSRSEVDPSARFVIQDAPGWDHAAGRPTEPSHRRALPAHSSRRTHEAEEEAAHQG